MKTLFMDVLERTLLNDNLVQTQLHLCSLYNSLLHRVFCDETKHTHRLCLANTMSTILFGCLWMRHRSKGECTFKGREVVWRGKGGKNVG